MLSEEVAQNFRVSAVHESIVLLPIPTVGRDSDDCCARANPGARASIPAIMIPSFIRFSFGVWRARLSGASITRALHEWLLPSQPSTALRYSHKRRRKPAACPD